MRFRPFTITVLNVLIAAALSLSAGGCKKKEGDSAGKSEKAKGKGKATAGVKSQTRTFEWGKLKITVDVPTGGWKGAKFGQDSFMFTETTGGFARSRFIVSSTCDGVCDTIEENLKKAAQSQMKAHSGGFQEIKLVKDEAQPDGRRIYITAKHGGKPVHHYIVYRWKKGWETAAKCMVMLLGDKAKHFEGYKKLCESMKAEQKK
jgi:hypothetical protein